LIGGSIYGTIFVGGGFIDQIQLPDAISIPKARPVKAIYVRQALDMIASLKEREGKQ